MAAVQEAALDAANDIRSAGCMQSTGREDPLLSQPRLEVAAAHLLARKPLAEALDLAAYRASVASSVRVRLAAGPDGASGRAIRAALVARFCTQLTSAEYREVGSASDGHDLWIVLAAPFAPPASAAAPAMHAQVLALVNDVRTRGRHCGATRFEPAKPLNASAVLERAASAHARDLAAIGRLEHKGSDGSRASDRIRRQGYSAIGVAENLAAGPTTAQQLVDGWVRSPSHCANLMNPRFTEMGIAYVVSTEGIGEIYWVQELAAASDGS